MTEPSEAPKMADQFAQAADLPKECLRQPNETKADYEMFARFRSAPYNEARDRIEDAMIEANHKGNRRAGITASDVFRGRTYSAIAAEFNRPYASVTITARKRKWVERAQIYDEWLDEQRTRMYSVRILEMEETHARVGRMLLTKAEKRLLEMNPRDIPAGMVPQYLQAGAAMEKAALRGDRHDDPSQGAANQMQQTISIYLPDNGRTANTPDMSQIIDVTPTPILEEEASEEVPYARHALIESKLQRVGWEEAWKRDGEPQRNEIYTWAATLRRKKRRGREEYAEEDTEE